MQRNVLSGEGLEAFRAQFKPIEGLEAGDKLRWKKDHKTCKFPEYGQVIEVFEVFEPLPHEPCGSNHDLDRYDFSVVVKDEGGSYEVFAFDSRRFELVK